MALKSNSKEVKETIKNYIMDHFNYYYECNVEYMDILKDIDPKNYNHVCSTILAIFEKEYICDYNRRRNTQDLFVEWTSGLCSAIDTDYWITVDAVKLLGSWLQETETETSKYTDEKACYMISSLIYRELRSHAK